MLPSQVQLHKVNLRALGLTNPRKLSGEQDGWVLLPPGASALLLAQPYHVHAGCRAAEKKSSTEVRIFPQSKGMSANSNFLPLGVMTQVSDFPRVPTPAQIFSFLVGFL